MTAMAIMMATTAAQPAGYRGASRIADDPAGDCAHWPANDSPSSGAHRAVDQAAGKGGGGSQ